MFLYKRRYGSTTNEIVVNIDMYYLVPVQCFAGYYHIKCDHLSGITVNPTWGGGGALKKDSVFASTGCLFCSFFGSETRFEDLYKVVLTNFSAQLVLQNLNLVVKVGGEEANGDDSNDSECSDKGKKVRRGR